MGENGARRNQQRIFATLRQGERGDYDVERGYSDVERGDYDVERGDYDVERGDYDVERGDYDVERGNGIAALAGPRAPGQTAADIFRTAVGLGGHLVISFVAPIGPAPAPGPKRRPRRVSAETQAAAARAHVAELIEQIRCTRAKARQQPSPATTPVTPRQPNDNGGGVATSVYVATAEPAQGASGKTARAAAKD